MYKIIKKVLILVLFCSVVNIAQSKILSLKLREKKLPFGLIEKIPACRPKIGIALSGGGSRSLAQIGILKALKENNIPIDDIAGTSMGSIVGGLLASGYSLDDLDSILTSTDWNEFFSTRQSDRNELFIDQKVTEDKAILTFRLDGFSLIIPKSLSSGQRVANFLTLLSLNAPLHTDSSFSNLLYNFKAVSTDLVTGKEVLLDSGSLSQAMRASSSVTFLLPPVEKDSMLLVDGGLVENIPVKPLRDIGGDIVIACNTSSPLYTGGELKYPWIIADQLVSIPMKILNDQQLKMADVVIAPELDDRKNTDFSDLDDLIKTGYISADSSIKNILGKYKKDFEEKLNEKEFFIHNPALEKGATPEEKFLSKYVGLDSVSNYQLLFELNKLYDTGDFQNLSIEINPELTQSVLRLVGVKNPVIRSVYINGVSLFPYSKIESYTDSLLNKPYNPKRILSAAINILKHYKNAGYSLAKINSITYDDSTQTLQFNMTEGMISKVVIEGLRKTKKEIITRDFKMKGGDFFKYSEAEKALIDLTSTNLFDDIELYLDTKNNKNILTISVKEKLSSVLRFGMRFDNENQMQLSFDLRDENFLGTGTELGAILSGGLRNRSYILEHKANRVFDSYFTYKIRAFYEFNDVNVYKDDPMTVFNRFSRSKTGEYRQIYYGGSFGIGTQVKKFGNLLFEAKYQRDEIKNKFDYTGPTYTVDIASFKATLSIDTQNEYPYPTSGSLLKAYYETAQTSLGGDIGYTKLSLDYKNYFNVYKNNVLNAHFILGLADQTLPLSEQFSFGGQNSFFGLRDNEFRGRQILIVSMEDRFKFPEKLFFDTYIKARYDLGSIWDEREQIRFKDLRHGIGATISLNTPIGPADFSIGKSFYLTNTLSHNTIVWGPTFFYFTIGYYY